MTSFEKLLAAMRNASSNVRFSDADKVARYFFGEPRITGSHHIYKTPWPGDPRVNLQSIKGKVNSYQVRQLIEAIDRLKREGNSEGTDCNE